MNGKGIKGIQMKTIFLKGILPSVILCFSCLVNIANAGLIFTVDTLTSDEFTFSISGSLDSDPLDGRGWLAIKNDWSNNIGIHTEFINSSLTTSSGGLFLGAVELDMWLENGSENFNDSIYWKLALPAPDPSLPATKVCVAMVGDPPCPPIYAGLAFSGTVSFYGIGAFDPSARETLELVSGYDNATQDWTRLEAANSGVVSAPGPSTLAIFALGMLGLASRQFKKQV